MTTMLHIGCNSDRTRDSSGTPIWAGGCQAIVPFMEGAGGRCQLRFPRCPAMPRAAILLVVLRGSCAVAQRRVDGI